MIVDGIFQIEDSYGKILIGKNTKLCGLINLGCIEGKSIIIEDNCLLSSDIVMRTGDSHSILNQSGKRINPSKDILIEEHVWIGNRVTINKGCIIKKNSIVGSGAIVTKAFHEEGVIIAGIPATIIKRNINWDIDRI